MKKLVLATHNKDKFHEMQKVLSTSGWELVPAFTLQGVPQVEEDGISLEENSFKKADVLCRFSGIAALADDTGLFVDALRGGPGIYAARYAGENCTYSDNVNKLLGALKDTPQAERSACFRTVITIRYPDDRMDQVSGEIKGIIVPVPKGNLGFGYDPVFKPNGTDRVFAEMSLEEKNAISHRGQTLRQALEVLTRNLS